MSNEKWWSCIGILAILSGLVSAICGMMNKTTPHTLLFFLASILIGLILFGALVFSQYIRFRRGDRDYLVRLSIKEFPDIDVQAILDIVYKAKTVNEIRTVLNRMELERLRKGLG